MERPHWAAPGMKIVESFLGIHIQSTMNSEKIVASGATRCYHVVEVHRGTIIVGDEGCILSFLHILPMSLNGG
jgi:hypothetical protein